MKQSQKAKLRELQKKFERKKGLPSLPNDKVQFFEEILHITPYPYQSSFLKDAAPLKVLRWPRRAGKTLIMSGDDLYSAMRYPNSKIIITMPKHQQIKEIYFAAFHEHLARIDRKIYDAYIECELQTIIRTTNGSVLLAETPEPFTIRGHGPRKISIDEMNFIREDEDLWLSALLPMTLTQRVDINVSSTPWNKNSVYYKMCYDKSFKIFSGNIYEKDPPRYFLTWREVQNPNGPLDPHQVEVMREQYAGDPWRWKREMESSFVDDETAFLPSSLLIKCQNEELEFAKFEDALQGDFFIGWDLGRERDHSAVAIVQKDSDIARLVHCKQFPLGTPYVTVMAYIKSICDRWRIIRALYYDHTGTKGMDEEIRKVGFPGLVGIDFTQSTKHSMAIVLKQAMMSSRESDKALSVEDARRRFELPFDQDVQAELNVVQWEQSPGSELYTFSHPEGSHDDRFWAIALAVYAAVKQPVTRGLVDFGAVGERS